MAQSPIQPSRFTQVEITPRGAGGKGHAPAVGAGTTVPLRIVLPAAQSANALEIVASDGVTVLFSISATGVPSA
jgi:hypothetical protein